ncbi:CRAL-TRIO domain containing protein [Oryctes borbonicus]|uniref:CRAL-TRIO domain containing protein n=1 Tax=Oryctes borbonicus TaxID=1629725 RepID=A0A0T6B5I6_9SCAR|nr:CRAL-TRIO domain containing protein [Oryctes borbonicus]
MCEVQTMDYDGNVLSEDNVKARIQDLRNLMLEQDDLKKMRIDDAFILRFLHRTQFHVENAFNTVKSYYSFIIDQSDWMVFDITNRMQDCLNMNMRAMLSATDKYGKKIYYMRTDTVNPTKLSFAELNQVDFIWFESVLDDPDVQKHGLCLLIDISGFSWRLINWLTPTNIKRLVRKLENIILKDATFHMVRCSKFAKLAISMVWPFLPDLLKEKFIFHYNDLKPLLKDISTDNLPKEYGGTLEVDFKTLNADLILKQKQICEKLEHYKLISS